MEIKQREIPLITNPYDDVDWITVRHIKTDGSDLSEVKDIYPGAMPIILRSSVIGGDSRRKILQEAGYFVVSKPNAFPSKIYSINVDNYDGTITIEAERTNKIQWISDNKIIKTKYTLSGKFTTTFNVENFKYNNLQFKLIGEGGETISQPFKLKHVLQ